MKKTVKKMRYIFLYILLALIGIYQTNGLSIFGKCVTDKECKDDEFCDHTGINPIGSCAQGKANNRSCVFDRHCRSKYCHHLKCIGKKPVKDGKCSRDHHEDCIESQYCSHRKGDKCMDRKCSGICGKDAHCLSNNCSFFKCKKPANGCQ